MIQLSLPYPPSANRYWRVWKGRAVKSAEAKKYQREIATICLVERVQPFKDDVVVSLEVYRPIKRGDLDNSIKVLL